MNQGNKKIALILGIVALAALLGLGNFKKQKLSGTLKEVPNEEITIKGTYRNDVFFNKATGQKEIIPETQPTPRSTANYKWLYAYGGNIEEHTLRTLSDGEFAALGKDTASSTRLLRVKRNGTEEIVEEKNLGISLGGRFLPIANAAITLRASSSLAVSTVTSVEYAFVTPAGLSNSTIIIAALHVGDGGQEFSSATVNGETASIGTITDGDLGTNPYNPAAWWYYNNPTSTTQTNIKVTKTGTNTRIYSAATLWDGVDVTGNPASASTTQGTDTGGGTKGPADIINNQISTTLNEVIWDHVWNSCGGAPIDFGDYGTGQVPYNFTGSNDCPTNTNQSYSYKVATSTGQSTMYENLAGAAAWQTTAVSLKVAVAAAGGSPVASEMLIFE